jgi:hypothetical protein
MSNTITLSYTNNFKPINNISPSQSLRIHCVSVRLNKEELELLNAIVEIKAKVNGFVWLPSKASSHCSQINLKHGNHCLIYHKS